MSTPQTGLRRQQPGAWAQTSLGPDMGPIPPGGEVRTPWGWVTDPATGRPYPPSGPLPQQPGTNPFGPGGFFGQGQQFLQGLFSGQIPESMRASIEENQARAQQALNQQLQQRGAYFGTPGLQMQSDLARRGAQDVSNLMFERAMQAIPQGMGMFGGAAGLAGIPSEMPPWLTSAMGLLGGLRGQVTQPQYHEDPFWQIVKSIIPFLF